MTLTIISAIVAFLVISLLALLLILSIDKLSKTTSDRIRHNASLIMNEYDEAIETRRRELEELSKANPVTEKIIYKRDTTLEAFRTPVLEKEKTLSNAEVYKILREEYDFDAVATAKKILANLPSAKEETKTMESILKKIDKETFAQLDTVDKETQLSLLKEVLASKEVKLIEKTQLYGISLYSYLSKNVELNKDKVEFYVSNKKIQKELKDALDIDSTISPEIIEGMNVVVNNKVYKYGIERNELQ